MKYEYEIGTTRVIHGGRALDFPYKGFIPRNGGLAQVSGILEKMLTPAQQDTLFGRLAQMQEMVEELKKIEDFSKIIGVDIQSPIRDVIGQSICDDDIGSTVLSYVRESGKFPYPAGVREGLTSTDGVLSFSKDEYDVLTAISIIGKIYYPVTTGVYVIITYPSMYDPGQMVYECLKIHPKFSQVVKKLFDFFDSQSPLNPQVRKIVENSYRLTIDQGLARFDVFEERCDIVKYAKVTAGSRMRAAIASASRRRLFQPIFRSS